MSSSKWALSSLLYLLGSNCKKRNKSRYNHFRTITFLYFTETQAGTVDPSEQLNKAQDYFKSHYFRKEPESVSFIQTMFCFSSLKSHFFRKN